MSDAAIALDASSYLIFKERLLIGYSDCRLLCLEIVTLKATIGENLGDQRIVRMQCSVALRIINKPLRAGDNVIVCRNDCVNRCGIVSVDW